MFVELLPCQCASNCGRKTEPLGSKEMQLYVQWGCVDCVLHLRQAERSLSRPPLAGVRRGTQMLVIRLSTNRVSMQPKQRCRGRVSVGWECVCPASD